LTRQQKKISQKELAYLSEINLKSLSSYELGTSIPPANALKAIADALEVSADYLLSDDQVAIKDKYLLQKFETIQNISGETRVVINQFLDLVISDHKTKQNYAS
jgi:transcriptional regulator with XRE-family HTH domain